MITLEIANMLNKNSLIEQIKLLTLLELNCYNETIECLSNWLNDEELHKPRLIMDIVCLHLKYFFGVKF